MYIPKKFSIDDKQEIFSFVESNSFGQLTSMVDGKLFVTHLPFVLSDDKSKLLMHVARQNPQHSSIEGQDCLVVLQGAHGYISPSWYKDNGVPTWNYQAVHIYGKCKVFEEVEKLQCLVDKTTTQYESKFSDPWVSNYNTKMLNAIVGIEMTITDMQCKYKLSQNRSFEDRMNVINKLKNMGLDSLAKEMYKQER